MTIRTDTNLIEFKKAADRFCSLLEVEPVESDQWLMDVLAAMARLYASGHALPDLDLSEDALDVPDQLDVTHEEWKRVFNLVHNVLGDQTGYWAYFDPSAPPNSHEEAVFGNLADDLADIFRDIKPGLRAWDTGVDVYLASIVFDWKLVFGSHWGLHAVGAMRALHQIAYLRGIQKKD
jgi:hypothetical protein